MLLARQVPPFVFCVSAWGFSFPIYPSNPARMAVRRTGQG